MNIFEEIQQVNKLITGALAGMSGLFLVMTLSVNKAFIIGVFLCFIFTIVLFSLRLEIKIYKNRLEYRLFPFHNTHKVISLCSIVKAEHQKSKSLGILGLKIKYTPSGAYYYFGGGTMLVLRTIEGKTFYFGTRQIDEMMEALKNDQPKK